LLKSTIHSKQKSISIFLFFEKSLINLCNNKKLTHANFYFYFCFYLLFN